MLSRDELLKLADPDDTKFTQEEWMGKQSVLSRGLPYYGLLKRKFPIHWSSFGNIHKRNRISKVGVDPLFERNTDGFVEFILYMGDIPEGMIWPNAGRIDHSKGYFIGNFRWESASSNNKEVHTRCKDIWEKTLQKTTLKRRKIPAELVKFIRDAKVGKLKHIENGKFVKDCIEWLHKRHNIKINSATIYSILKYETYKDVI